MAKLRENGELFRNFNYAQYATDVHFVQGNRPAGTLDEARPHFSGKHNLYINKVECSVALNGQAVNWTKHYRGGMHDKEIFEKNIKFHQRSTKKTQAELATLDHGELFQKHPKHWTILLDKACIGIEQEVRAVLPTKQRPRRNLTREEHERNVEQASDCVIVENFFGRSCQIGGIIGRRYNWSRERFDTVMDLIFCLTNYHVMLHPLRAADGEYYRRVLAELKRLGEESKTKDAKRQRLYRQRQAAVDASLGQLDGDFSDISDDNTWDNNIDGENGFGSDVGAGGGGGNSDDDDGIGYQSSSSSLSSSSLFSSSSSSSLSSSSRESSFGGSGPTGERVLSPNNTNNVQNLLGIFQANPGNEEEDEEEEQGREGGMYEEEGGEGDIYEEEEIGGSHSGEEEEGEVLEGEAPATPSRKSGRKRKPNVFKDYE